MLYLDNTLSVSRCCGNGHGICFRCKVLGRQPIHWMSMLYTSVSFPGLICSNCLREVISFHPGLKFEVV